MKKEDVKLTERVVPGPALHYLSYIPDAPRAMVGMLHGYADHAARYAHVQGAWAERGIASVALDLRGHGRADGRRGYCSSFDEFLDDTRELDRLVRDRAGSVPRFLFGHSFGGLVAASAVLADPKAWKGLVLSSPYFDLALKVPGAKVLAARLASVVLPTLALPSGLAGKDLTHDAARARLYDEDPLVFKKATSRWFVASKRAQVKALEGAPALLLPLYVLFGEADPVASLAAGKAFYERAGSQDKTWDARPGLFHETLNEPEWPAIAGAIADWLLERL